jgi:hypothetical protein
MYKRSEYQIITSRLKEPRKFIQVVMGPRQVGKSTVVKQVLQDLDLPYQQFSADNVPASNTAWVSNCWAAVRSLKESKGLDSMILVIDEIQKISNWSEVVKKEWDDDNLYDRNIKVLLLDSSRVLLEKGLSEVNYKTEFDRFDQGIDAVLNRARTLVDNNLKLLDEKIRTLLYDKLGLDEDNLTRIESVEYNGQLSYNLTYSKKNQMYPEFYIVQTDKNGNIKEVLESR